MDEFKKNLKQSTGMRIFIYLMALLVCTLIGVAVAALFTLGNDITGLKIGQGISSALMFIAPPLVLYAFTRTEPMRQIGFRKPAHWWMLLVGIALMFVSLPLTNILGTWNENANFGETLERLLKMMEDMAGDLTDRMLQVDTFWGLLGNLLVIALIPAIGEELTFRGVLQQALTRRCNPHVAIWLSAFIFSFIHFQFYGFLPRMFLGLILGYMFYYSGSLWTSILMHFINNGTAVVVAYLDYKGLANADWEHFGSTSNVALLITSLVLTVGMIVIVAKNQYKYGRE
ncbi:MAG: CPBP family intramembrane metalloprotease [Bacteroidales bacterium]|nr:CPBP family intramembrane metalloprotease [Bacteroidales bacterium]